MGSSDRDYFREERRMAMPSVPPVTKALLISVIAIYLLDLLFGERSARAWGAYTTADALFRGRIWQLVTFQFFHGHIAHLLMNCVGIFFFAPFMERWWGGRRFLIFYLLCGVGGALFYSLLTLLHVLPSASIYTPLVGASAGIYGCLVGVARTMPEARVRLILPPIELSLRQLALGVVGIAVAVILGDLVLGLEIFSNAGGEAGHLGGALVGFLLIGQPQWLGKRGGRQSGRSSSGHSGGSGRTPVEAKILRPKEFSGRRKVTPTSKLRPRSSMTQDESSDIDRILDKINREGLGSLTDEERRLLQEAARDRDN